MKNIADTMVEKTAAALSAGATVPSSFWISMAGISRWHIAAIGAAAALTFGWLFTGTYVWTAVALAAVDWYLINLMNQTVDLQEDAVNQISGVQFTRRHRRALLYGAVAVTLASLLAGCWISPAVTGLRIAFHVLGAFYNYPLLRGRRRIKQMYFWKNAASAAGFIITCFGYPLAMSGELAISQQFPASITWATVLCTALYFFLFEVSFEIIYDIRDIDGDRAAGIRTYAVVHGLRVAVRIIDGLIFSSMAVLILGYIGGVVPWRIVIMAAAPLLQLIMYKRALARSITARDCILITWTGVALLVFYNLWVVARLPGSEI